MNLEQKLERVNRWRVREGPLWSKDDFGWNGAFLVPLDGEMWQVICSDRWDWKHVSVKNHHKKVIPTWIVMCRIKDLFFDDQDWVVQFHPAKDDYVDIHPFVLHLWQPLKEELPKPLFIMV